MSEAEVLTYLLQYKKATPPEVAHHCEENLLSVHQALLRLERKGLVRKKKLSYNVEFTLTEKAQNLNQQTKQNDSFLPFILFLGLATFILLLVAGSGKDNKNTSDQN
jgi:DNA-binding MarR family transcriptional regulator